MAIPCNYSMEWIPTVRPTNNFEKFCFLQFSITFHPWGWNETIFLVVSSCFAIVLYQIWKEKGDFQRRNILFLFFCVPSIYSMLVWLLLLLRVQEVHKYPTDICVSCVYAFFYFVCSFYSYFGVLFTMLFFLALTFLHWVVCTIRRNSGDWIWLKVEKIEEKDAFDRVYIHVLGVGCFVSHYFDYCFCCFVFHFFFFSVRSVATTQRGKWMLDMHTAYCILAQQNRDQNIHIIIWNDFALADSKYCDWCQRACRRHSRIILASDHLNIQIRKYTKIPKQSKNSET